MRSGRSSRTRVKASLPLLAVVTAKPAKRSAAASRSRMFASSSTTSRRAVSLMSPTLLRRNILGVQDAVGVALFGEEPLAVVSKFLVDGIAGNRSEERRVGKEGGREW